MRKLPLLILSAFLCCAAPTFTGCTTTQQTVEAKKFYSFKTTYNLAKQAYVSYLTLQAKQGKMKPEANDVDRAWMTFNESFQLAFRAASLDWNAATPAQVQALADNLLNLIAKL